MSQSDNPTLAHYNAMAAECLDDLIRALLDAGLPPGQNAIEWVRENFPAPDRANFAGTRFVEWSEPFSKDGKAAVVCRMSVDDVIHFQMTREDFRYPDPHSAFDDFVTVHWATIKNIAAPDWQACAEAILNDERVLQISRAHASARPKPENPAWRNTHHDLGYVLNVLKRCACGEFGPKKS